MARRQEQDPQVTTVVPQGDTAAETPKASEARMVRVYHPEADTYMDVEASRKDEWVEGGWRATPGDHNKTEGYPALPNEPVRVVGVEHS